MIIYNGRQRFEYQLVKLEALLIKAASEDNPAGWLYTNDARTPLFMLEGLSKLYAGIHNKALFKKLRDHFKALEDGFGAIDYYDSFAKEFATNAGIAPSISKYLAARKERKIQQVNDLLKKNKWIKNGCPRLRDIRHQLSAADWKDPEKEVKAILEFYKRAIKKLKKFMAAFSGFDEIETEMHSMRRKLRWLSIYAQALNGMIQLTGTKTTDENLKKYVVEEVVNSPFNKMPPPEENQWLLLFEKDYFFALSWIIQELGTLKDNGLRIIAAAEAVAALNRITSGAAIKKSCRLFNRQPGELQKILNEGYLICRQYFNERNLDKLLYGISPATKYAEFKS